MRFLITGATGMIGQAIVKRCHTLGVEINYLTTSKEKLTKKENYTGFYWNPSTGEIDADCLNEVDVIINLAGANIANRWTSSYKKEIINSRTQSAETLYNCLKNNHHEVQHIVSASAIGVYPSSFTKFYEEDENQLGEDFVGTVVKKWEDAVDQFSDLGIQVAKIRIGLVLTSNGGALEKMVQPIQYYVGAPLGSGKQWQSWIHIDDLVEIFMHLIKHQLSGVFNAVSPNPVTNTELTKAIAEVVNKPLFMPNIPKFMLKLLLGEMATIVLSSQLVSSKKIEQQGYDFQYTQLKRALTDLLK
ncbi:MAG: TIGR01777 family oxidoreductase [Bacteroidota bacterium]